MAIRDPSCDDDFDHASLTCNEAIERILAAVEVVEGHERLHLRAALGRVLAGDIHSPVDVPQHTNSAMDGYAVRAADLPTHGTARFTVIGTAFAGRPFDGAAGAAQAVRIMTGAPLPDGTDTVIMQEHVASDGAAITVDGQHQRGQNVRAAGEDLRRGQRVLARGHRLGAAELGLVASLGIGEVDVTRRVRVAYFSTGDELRSIGEPLGRGEIFDSNRYTLYGMLREAGAEIIDMGVVRDTREAVEQALREAAAVADVVITSGGVSVGEADYIKSVLAAIGQVGFWKVAMKPGRPLAFGRIGRARFFGLPGNPVSVMVTFQQFVLPALTRMAGAAPRPPLTLQARTTATLKKRPGRMEFQRGMLARGADGVLEVTPTGDQGSGILHSMSTADCYIVLDIGCGRVEPGSLVDVQPFTAAG
ncbi:MAG: molybdopterin molybdotransferase MoeA [Gammaproteobacteria bacterium]|nr:molybdopterin molybdotransferase MoeA [Gammaproteobacteria bacterium]MCP5201975.1 molybdopterin molybdotransferase MoeA [Gammaproteobacteria bacterium]